MLKKQRNVSSTHFSSSKFRGYEVNMLEDAAKYLNFSYQIGYPPDDQWGSIKPDGSWNGFVYEISQNNFDFVMSDCFVSFMRDQVSDGSITFSRDFLTIATPRPQIRSKVLNMIYPYEKEVWLLVFIALFTFGFSFQFISRMEGKIVNWHFKDWYTYSDALW